MTKAILWTLCALVLTAVAAHADRYYGNLNASYFRQFAADGITGYTQQQQQLSLNYEDVLFYKNRLRLGMLLYRTQREQSDAYNIRPIYSLNLSSYGYNLRSTYSPYKREQIVSLTGLKRTIYTREVRNVLTIQYPDYPTLSIAYNSLSNFDNGAERLVDTRNRNLLAQASHSVNNFSAGAAYNQIDLINKLPGMRDRRLQTVTTSVNGSRQLARFITVSSGYSFYDSRSRVSDAATADQNSQVHSINALAGTRQIHRVSGMASYSGNFFTATRPGNKFTSSNQSITGQLGYYPASYASIEVTKSYQVTNESGETRPLEYLAFTGNLTRYLRRGVTTRLSASRIIYQQSGRDETSALDAPDSYATDTYYGSLGFRVGRGVRLLADLSLTHTDHPVEANQRYQLQRLLVAQLSLSRTLEGRVTANWSSAASELQIFRSQSLSYNYGLSWTPNATLTGSISYSYNAGLTADRAKYGSLTGFFNYSFRRAFALSVAVSQQQQERLIPQPGTDGLLWKVRPSNVNATFTVFLTKTVTANMGYTTTKNPRLNSSRDLRVSSLTANVNMRL